MRSINNGRWMLAVLVAASVIAPGIVAARQQRVAGVERAGAWRTELTSDQPAAPFAQFLDADPKVGTCFNRTCTSSAQCRTWCDEPSAQCVTLQEGSHYKYCFLP